MAVHGLHAGARLHRSHGAAVPAVNEAAATPVTAREAAVAALRIGTGFVFLWAFLDKTFGLGYSTAASKAWIHGGSPTKGFLARLPFVQRHHAFL